MLLRNETITLWLKRKALPPVAYERIDGNNVRIGTTWFCLRRGLSILDPMNPGVMIFYERGCKRFISNSWYPINTDGTYQEFEDSFDRWIKSLWPTEVCFLVEVWWLCATYEKWRGAKLSGNSGQLNKKKSGMSFGMRKVLHNFELSSELTACCATRKKEI